MSRKTYTKYYSWGGVEEGEEHFRHVRIRMSESDLDRLEAFAVKKGWSKQRVLLEYIRSL